MNNGISEREHEVLSWLQQGMSKNVEQGNCACAEHQSAYGARHLQRDYQHLEVSTRAELIMRTRA